jgi:hypothetical protein
MLRGFSAVALGGAGVVAVLGMAACGSGSGGSGPGSAHSPAAGSAGAAQAVETAYRSTAGEKTVAFRINETMQAASSGGSSANMAITGSGQADLASHAFTISMNVPTGGSLTMLESGGIEYLQVPAAARSQVPGHRSWESVNLDKVTQAKLGKSFSQLASASSSDPAQALQQLGAVSSGVSKAGAATVAGVPVTEYRAEVSLDKLASQMQAKAGTRAAQAIRQEETTLGRTSLPVQVWVDAQHLVRQVRYQIPLVTASGGAGTGTATLTMTFTSFGAPVDVAPPPASQVADITSQVLQQAKASSG